MLFSKTVGAAFGSKKIVCHGKEFIMGIWVNFFEKNISFSSFLLFICFLFLTLKDTAGQERFESMSRIYYKDAKAAIVCYDVTSEESYNKLTFWTNELVTNEPECVIFLVGTKIDLLNDGATKKEVSTDRINNFATANGIPISNVFETSAKDGTNVDELFSAVSMVYNSDKSASNNDENLVDLTKKREPQQSSGGCC